MKLTVPLFHWKCLENLTYSTKCNFKKFIYVVKMKISDFQKTHFFSIILTFIDDFTLNSDNYKGNLKFGLCWPLLAFIGLCGLG